MITLRLTSIPAISAVYFALLQTGYEFHTIERDDGHIKTLSSFLCDDDFSYFSAARQNTCSVYPFWPRAALLETSSFYLDEATQGFSNMDELYRKIMSMSNLKNEERNQNFWDWLSRFPSQLKKVLSSASFQNYLLWENEWLTRQREKWNDELSTIQQALQTCDKRFSPAVSQVEILLNPIKCIYSADYHMIGNRFVFSSGRFSADSVIHEFLHPVVKPVLEKHRHEILSSTFSCDGIDSSYFLNGGETGKLNAFEEIYVRNLTKKLINNEHVELDVLLDELL